MGCEVPCYRRTTLGLIPVRYTLRSEKKRTTCPETRLQLLVLKYSELYFGVCARAHVLVVACREDGVNRGLLV